MPAVQRLGKRPPDRPAGVVDQDVHSAKGFLDIRDEVVDGVEIGQVASQRHRVPARGGDPPGDHVQQFLPARDDHHGGAAASDFSAAAWPMPDEAPVSRTRLPLRSTGLRSGL